MPVTLQFACENCPINTQVRLKSQISEALPHVYVYSLFISRAGSGIHSMITGELFRESAYVFRIDCSKGLAEMDISCFHRTGSGEYYILLEKGSVYNGTAEYCCVEDQSEGGEGYRGERGGGGKVENLNAGQRLGNDDSQTQERERGGGGGG